MRAGDGGPAFPTPESHGDDYEGMSLRDYFAAKAMQGMFAFGPDKFCAAGERMDHEISRQAYLVADAMLAVRAK